MPSALASEQLMTPKFAAMEDAQRWLLRDAAKIAARRSSVAVVGGWCSVLNNHRENGLHHPGTKDVDLLFEHGATAGELAEAVEDLLKAGYIASAKHGFQLIRVIEVGSRTLAFSVDLLHPSPARIDLVAEMFSKHVDLGVDRVPGANAGVYAVSIGTPLMGAVFDHDLLVKRELEPAGLVARFLDDAGLIISKSSSVMSAKRQRDSLDLFLAVAQPMEDSRHLEANLVRSASSEPVRQALEGLLGWLTSEDGQHDFDSRVIEQVEMLEVRGAIEQTSRLEALTGGSPPSSLLIALLKNVVAHEDVM